MLKKLFPNSFHKEKCVLHYKNVQTYVRLRLKVAYIVL